MAQWGRGGVGILGKGVSFKKNNLRAADTDFFVLSVLAIVPSVTGLQVRDAPSK